MNIWIVQRVQKRIMLSSGPSYLNLRFLRDLREEMYDTFVNISNSVNPPKMTSNNENIVFRVTSVSSWKVQQFNIYFRMLKNNLILWMYLMSFDQFAQKCCILSSLIFILTLISISSRIPEIHCSAFGSEIKLKIKNY